MGQQIPIHHRFKRRPGKVEGRRRVFVLGGGIVLGGVFTLILVPIAGVAVAAGIAYSMWARAAGGAKVKEGAMTDKPLPHSEHRNTAPAPSTPDDLVNARQQ